MAQKEISEEKMRRYFDSSKDSKVYTRCIVSIFIGIVLFIIGVAGSSTAGSSVAVLAACGFVLVVLGITIIILRIWSGISDRDYDAWVEWQGDLIEETALQSLHMDKSDLILREPLVLHGVIPPDERGFFLDKKGQDGHYRYSRNIFTFFYPTEHKIAILTSDVNALAQQTQMRLADHHFYTDLVGLSEVQKNAGYRGSGSQMTLQSFVLKVNSGEIVEVGGVLGVKITDLNNKKKRAEQAFTGTDVDKTVATLLKLIEQKKREPQQLQIPYQAAAPQYQPLPPYQAPPPYQPQQQYQQHQYQTPPPPYQPQQPPYQPAQPMQQPPYQPYQAGYPAQQPQRQQPAMPPLYQPQQPTPLPPPYQPQQPTPRPVSSQTQQSASVPYAYPGSPYAPKGQSPAPPPAQPPSFYNGQTQP
jgi:hypothetical protein